MDNVKTYFLKINNFVETNYIHSFFSALIVALLTSLSTTSISAFWCLFTISLSVFIILFITNKKTNSMELVSDIGIGLLGSALALFLHDLNITSNADKSPTFITIYTLLGIVILFIDIKFLKRN